MNTITNGLVLKQVKLGEADRILTLLTPELGIVAVAAKGSLRPKSKLFSASGLFSYAEWSLREGKTIYRVDEASVLEVFFGLRENIESVAVATYIAEMLQIVSPIGSEAAELLRLALNSFHLLAAQKSKPDFVKMVFELRGLTESGFMPNLLACRACSKYEGGLFYFDTQRGELLCEDCAREQGFIPNLDEGALAALRHIVLCDAKKVFHFELKPQSHKLLCKAAESFVLYHLDYPPKSLTFLKTMLTQ